MSKQPALEPQHCGVSQTNCSSEYLETYLSDVHTRVGGASGTFLTPEECPASPGTNPASCQAASLLLHLTPEASGYFENMWLWVADHMIEYVRIQYRCNWLDMQIAHL